METRTAPRPNNAEMPQPEPPIVIEGQLADTERFRATSGAPRQGGYAPPIETRQPAPIKLHPREAQKRITPLGGTEQNWRGEPTITSAKSRLAVHQERINRSPAGNFAVQSLGKAVKYLQAKKEEWERGRRYW